MLPLCSRSTAMAAILFGILACAAGSEAWADGLIRVEPRPYYGAVVTVEHGVRVYRPLPRQEMMVISPDPRTPVTINYTKSIDNRSYEAPSSPPVDGGLRYGDGGYGYGGFYGGLGYGNGYGNGYGYNNGHFRRAGRELIPRRFVAHGHIRRPRHH